MSKFGRNDLWILGAAALLTGLAIFAAEREDEPVQDRRDENQRNLDRRADCGVGGAGGAARARANGAARRDPVA